MKQLFTLNQNLNWQRFIKSSLLTSALVACTSFSGMIYAQNKFLGNILGPNDPAGGDYSLFVPDDYLNYWNQVTPENDTKWGYVENGRDTFDQNAVDRAKTIYQYAKDNNIPFKFHTLIWGRPDQDEETWRADLSDAEMLEETVEWFNWVNTNFPDMEFIDVVNEYLNEDLSYASAFSGQVTTTNFPGLNADYQGPAQYEWIVWAFLKARQTFPAETKLLINDFQIINGQQSAEYKVIIETLQGYTLNGRPIIDGIGIQSHTFNVIENGGEVQGRIESVLNDLATTGLPIYISELDVERNHLAEYQRIFPKYWQHPAVAGVTLWGYSVGRTWLDGTGLVNHDVTPHEVNEALNWMMTYLYLNPNPPNNFDNAIDATVSTGRTDDAGRPVAHWEVPFPIYAAACPDGFGEASFTMTFAEGHPTVTGVMTRAADGSFSAQVGPLAPAHGEAVLTISRTCAGVTKTQEVPMYIDPSGLVRTLTGEPVVGGTVTLYRSDSETGVFTIVPNGSDIMSPRNRTNPDKTGAYGDFGWDVTPGYYKVRAEHANCVSPTNPAQKYVETAVMYIPPEVTNLDIRLNCSKRGTLVSVTKNSDWGSGYCADVKITNTSTNPLTWIGNFQTEGNIYDFWNATYAQSGNSVSASGLNWNKTLAPGASLTDVGFCANRNNNGNYPIVVRARGTSGQEKINLTVGGQIVATWTLSNSFQNYTVNTNLAGGINVVYTNDAANRDVVVDYVSINNVVHQAEAQTSNTAAWDGACGQGKLSEWMHCNGYIGFNAFR